MKKKLFTLVFCFILIFTQLIQGYCSSPSPSPSSSPSPTQTPSSYITIEFDKTDVKINDIIKASVTVNGFNMLAGYQVCITYDPEVLVPVEANRLRPYRNYTEPSPGNILNNDAFQILSAAAHDVNNGMLYFGRQYMLLSDYKASSVNECSGVTNIIYFKVMSDDIPSTTIQFTNNDQLGEPSVSGTLLNDCDLKFFTSADYYVLQPKAININKSYKLTGYVKSELEVDEFYKKSSNFFVKADDSSSAFSYWSGYFEIRVLQKPAIYTLTIQKPGYLAREIHNVNVTQDTEINSYDSPIVLWAGDINQDGVINDADIALVEASFNTTPSDPAYNINCDLNEDDQINLVDLSFIARHYNACTADYPSL